MSFVGRTDSEQQKDSTIQTRFSEDGSTEDEREDDNSDSV